MYGTLCYNVPYNRKENMSIEEVKLKAIREAAQSINRDNDLLKLFGKATENMQIMSNRILTLEERVKRLEDDKK